MSTNGSSYQPQAPAGHLATTDVAIDSEICTADFAPAQASRVTSGFTGATLQSALNCATAGRARRAGWRRYAAGLFHPPALLAEREPGIDQLRRYARHARYAPRTGFRRGAGIAWCYLVAIPALVSSRAAAWGLERPARFLVVAATVKALTFLPPVAWAVEHLIVPSVDAALRLFL